MSGDEANSDTGAGAGRSLLLVDDDQVWLQRLAVAMERRGFAVTTAGSVKDAIDVAKRGPPD